jgi:hypothetical protein
MGHALSCRLCNRSGLTFPRSETESELASTNEKFELKDVGRTGCLVKREAACVNVQLVGCTGSRAIPVSSSMSDLIKNLGSMIL